MVSKQYARGYQAEIRTQKYLEGLGFYCIRSYASKSDFDLYAFREDQALFVQCKRVKNPIKKTQSIFNRYKVELGKISQINAPEACLKLLGHYTDKQPGSRSGTLKFYKIFEDHLEEIDIK